MPRLAKILGIKFDSIFTYSKSRKDARIYSDGVFVQILKLITGMNLRVSDDTRSKLFKLQRDHSGKIYMLPYFNEIANKEMTVLEFEHFLSRVLLIETNRIFTVFTKEQEQELSTYSIVVFEVLNGLSGGMIDGFWIMIKNVRSLYRISKILKSAPEHLRLSVFGPQLSLVTNFSKMLVNYRKDFKELEPWNFLDLKTLFFVYEEHETGHLVFLDRSADETNSVSNRAFGTKYIMCPAAKMTIEFITSVLDFLQIFDIELKGTAIYKGSRFSNISNKADLHIIFKPLEPLPQFLI